MPLRRENLDCNELNNLDVAKLKRAANERKNNRTGQQADYMASSICDGRLLLSWLPLYLCSSPCSLPW